MTRICDALGCCRPADLAYIGPPGTDLYLCFFHGGTDEVEDWTRIEHEASPDDG